MGNISGEDYSGKNAIFSGDVKGANARFIGNVYGNNYSGTNATFSGDIISKNSTVTKQNANQVCFSPTKCLTESMYDSLLLITNSLNGTNTMTTTTGLNNTGRFTNVGSLEVKNGDISGNFVGNLAALKGMIVMWSGSTNSIPNDWALCDGTYNTPDLRSRFILGASKDTTALPSNLTPKVYQNMGGTETVTLDITQIPAHSHSSNGFVKWGTGASSGTIGYSGGSNAIWGTSNIGNIGGDTQNGKTVPHNNMPPYYTLAFIMKL